MLLASPLQKSRWMWAFGLIFAAWLNGAAAHADHFKKYLTSADEKLKLVLQDLQVAYANNDTADLMDFFPSKLLQQVAKDANLSELELRRRWTESKPISADKDGGGRLIEFFTDRVYSLKLKSGLPIVLVPTVDKMTIDGKKATIELYTLAFEEEGRWRIVMMHDEAQYGTLTKVYPEFRDDTIPREIQHGYRVE
jgi:hypothetical protein